MGGFEAIRHHNFQSLWLFYDQISRPTEKVACKLKQSARMKTDQQLVAVEPSTEPVSPETEAGLAEGTLVEDDRLRRLDDAIAMLPALYKEPLLLATIGGLSQQATAAALKTTPKAIEMRLRRARQQLSSLLDPARERHAGSLPSKKKRFTR